MTSLLFFDPLFFMSLQGRINHQAYLVKFLRPIKKRVPTKPKMKGIKPEKVPRAYNNLNQLLSPSSHPLVVMMLRAD